MNYIGTYNDLITKAKNFAEERQLQKKQKLNYFEKHHIIPKCLGGSNEECNLVLLTAKEHFICHKLLCEIYPDNRKLKYALWNMINRSNNHKRMIRYIPSGKIYEKIRIEYSKFFSLHNPGKNKSEETRIKISNAHKGRPSSRKGKFHSEESRLKMSLWQLGSIKGPKSNIAKINMSLWQKGKCKPKVECPNCKKIGSISNMKRYHFDNCKLILEVINGR